MKSGRKDPLKGVSLTPMPGSAAHSGKHMGKKHGVSGKSGYSHLQCEILEGNYSALGFLEKPKLLGPKGVSAGTPEVYS